MIQLLKRLILAWFEKHDRAVVYIPSPGERDAVEQFRREGQRQGRQPKRTRRGPVVDSRMLDQLEYVEKKFGSGAVLEALEGLAQRKARQ